MSDEVLSKIDTLMRDLALIRQEARIAQAAIDAVEAPYLSEIEKVEAETARKVNDIRLRMIQARSEDPVYEQMQAIVFRKQEEESKLIEQVRWAVVERYAETKKRDIASGISITVRNNLVYNEQDALEWCAKNMPSAVKIELRKRDFEKHARAVSKTIPLPFVTLEEAVDVAINTDSIDYPGGSNEQ